jgi:hypothetical protein
MTDKELAILMEKIYNGTATQQEKDYYIDILHKNDKITKAQYKDYRKGRNVESVIKSALIIGGAILLGVLYTDAVKK